MKRLSSLLLLTTALGVVTVEVHGHVALQYPPGRTNNDYLYTFDGTCVNESCNSFCGDPYNLPQAPVTKLPVNTPINIHWYSPVPHQPYKYRLSLNRKSGSDGDFDLSSNILTIVNANDARSVGNGDDNGGNNNNFVTTVTIPSDALNDCNDESNPCVLQLFDLYYFVSCANVVLTTEDEGIVDMDQEMKDSMSGGSNTFFDIDQALDGIGYDANDYDLIRIEAASFVDYRISTTSSSIIAEGDESSSSASSTTMTNLLDPTLNLKRCQTYIIGLYTPGHPFVIKTKPGTIGVNDNLYEYQPLPYNGEEGDGDGEEVVIAPEQGIFEFTIPITSPSTLYYQCTLHEEMVGTINIIDDDDYLLAGFDSCEDYYLATASLSSSAPQPMMMMNGQSGLLLLLGAALVCL